MLPGPDDVLECPACHAPVTSHTLLSGNTFGARFYTDGHMQAPMLPLQPALVRCPECAVPFVRREARVLGEIDRYGFGGSEVEPPAAWRQAREVGPAEPQDYVAVLDRACFDRDTEIALLVELWHAGNHARRELPDDEPGVPLSPQEAGTLHRLAAVLDAAVDEERLMLAEVWRELGEFDRAIALLAHALPPEFARNAQRILALARSGSRRVAQVEA